MYRAIGSDSNGQKFNSNNMAATACAWIHRVSESQLLFQFLHHDCVLIEPFVRISPLDASHIFGQHVRGQRRVGSAPGRAPLLALFARPLRLLGGALTLRLVIGAKSLLRPSARAPRGRALALDRGKLGHEGVEQIRTTGLRD